MNTMYVKVWGELYRVRFSGEEKSIEEVIFIPKEGIPRTMDLYSLPRQVFVKIKESVEEYDN